MKSIAKSAALIVAMMLLSKVLGIIREICLADRFGASYIVDAYTICCSLPSILFTIFASGFARSYLPVYSRVESLDAKRELFSNTTCILFSISLLISLLCCVFSSTIVSVMAPGFEGRTFQLADYFVKIISAYLPFFTVFSILGAQASADEDFIFSYFCDFIIANIVIILSVLLATPEKPNNLVYGYVVSSITPTFLLMIHLWRKGIRIVPRFKIRDSNFRLLAAAAIPIGISVFVNQANALIDRVFSSSLGEGITSALNYANKVHLIPYSLVVSVFISVCRPRMNKCFAENNMAQGTEYIKKAVQIAIYLSVPVVMILSIFASPIIKLLFERGAFTSEATIMTAECLVMYSFGIPFYAFREIASDALNANLKQRLVLKNTLITVAGNVLLNFILVRSMSYRGLALATSIAGIISFGLMTYDLKKCGVSAISKDQTPEILKIIIASIVTVFICYICNMILQPYLGGNIAILVSLVIACITYIMVGILSNIKTLKWAYGFLPSKIKKINKWNN